MSMIRGRIPVRLASPTIYNAVDFFEHSLFPVIPRRPHRPSERVRLARLLNLHNLEGMRDVPQIKDMLQQILAGGEVLHDSGLPNVKLVTTLRGEWVLFDGHHTTVAYIAAGKRYLHELPHLVVHQGTGPIPDKDIMIVFGNHASRLSVANWREFVINWQAAPGSQLAGRIQYTMRGLFEALARKHAFLSPSPISI